MCVLARVHTARATRQQLRAQRGRLSPGDGKGGRSAKYLLNPYFMSLTRLRKYRLNILLFLISCFFASFLFLYFRHLRHRKTAPLRPLLLLPIYSEVSPFYEFDALVAFDGLNVVSIPSQTTFASKTVLKYLL